MKKLVILLSAIAIVTLVALLASASFNYIGNTVETDYISGETIKGYVNISFSNEPSNSLFTSNLGGKISLLELLEKNDFEEGVDYNCSSINCLPWYEAGAKITSLTLSANQPKIVGFKITGSDISVSSLKFSIASNAAANCQRQILVDLLDKNETFIQNDKTGSNACGSENWGCFDSSSASESVRITSSEYCEKISLPEAAGYKIGAIITSGAGSPKLTMKIYEKEWQNSKSCELPSVSGTKKVSCIVNYSEKTGGDYFVCISADKNTEYRIRIEDSGTNCGSDDMGSSYPVDYEIFAQPIEFGAPGTIVINESSYSGLAYDADAYIYENYERNCTRGCVIPFKIYGIAQELTFSNVKIEYEKKGGATDNSDFYLIEKKSSLISTAKPLNINIEKAGFEIPFNYSGRKTFELYLDGDEILSKTINVTKGFDFNITHTDVLLGEEILFQALTAENIVKSIWNFGDGATETTAGTLVKHTYLPSSYRKEGYKVDVELTSANGAKARKSINVTISNLNDSAWKLVRDIEYRIGNLTRDKGNFPQNIAGEIEKQLSLSEINSELSKIKTRLANATKDEDYASIIGDALELNVPSSIKIKEEGKAFPFSIGFANIDLSYLQRITASEEISEKSKESIKTAIFSWLDKNYDAKIDYTMVKSVYADGREEPLLTAFKISLNTKEGYEGGESYLIIGRPINSISFLGNYSEKEIGSGTYIPISGSKTIEFAIKGEIKPGSLGIYLSPALEEIYTKYEIYEEPGFRWGRFFLWTFILLVLAFVIYVLLYEWYKKHYENYLFKNPDDLYNVISFIYYSRAKGMKDDEIRKKLSEAGWSGEKIEYAFRKLDGKRTGMWEIPILMFFEKKRVAQEIAKREYKFPMPAPKAPAAEEKQTAQQQAPVKETPHKKQ
ncbi:MAG: hypothetical protein QXD13_00410 [Candidatus Pacearchaeota archaeon]